MTTPLSLTRLLQLSSVSLPVGGYSFSQGMEYAIECGWLKNVHAVEEWLRMVLEEGIARVDLPILRGCMQSAEEKDWQRFQQLNQLSIACRETKELRLTETAMGEALLRLLKSLDFSFAFETGQEWSFVALFGFAAQVWQIDYEDTANGFTWSWLENQVAAATKLVPLGQTQAQCLLTRLQPEIAFTITKAEATCEAAIGGGLPAMAIASALHETQYSRLFRS